MPYAVGLEKDGETLLKPFCPPYYPSMRAAVLAAVENKFGANGIFRSHPAGTAWANAPQVTRDVPPTSQAAIAATVSCCEYLWERYGRFPVYLTPYRTVLGFQACHLDAEFYDRFYAPEALAATQREDFQRHGSGPHEREPPTHPPSAIPSHTPPAGRPQ